MKILVTGGTGFIGSHLVDKLVFSHDVIIYDNLRVKPCINKNATLVKADIVDYKTLLKNLKNVDIVFHLAAIPGVRYSMEHPIEVFNTNVMGTLNVLKASVENNVKRVVFASSSSIYGGPEKIPITESTPFNPISPYALSKVMGEELCDLFTKLNNLEIVKLRYFTVYGPRGRSDMCIGAFIKKMLNNERSIVFGDGTQARSFSYVEDIVEGTILAGMKEDISGEALNLAGKEMIDLNTILDILKKCLKTDLKPIYTDWKKGDVYKSCGDISKAKKLLGWKPKVDIEDGIKRTVEFEKSHLK